MKTTLTLLILLAFFSTSHAQLLKKVQQKLESKAEKTIDDLLDKKETKPSTTSGGTTAAGNFDFEIIESNVPFLRGSEYIFSDNLLNDAPGTMPKYWQTNSTGSVVEIKGTSGKWLQLAPQASYQLDTLLHLPSKFTLEFDLLTRANEANDLQSIEFGFSKNNSTNKYIYGTSNEVSLYQTLLFQYEAISTKGGNKSSQIPFPLSNYANAIMHVSMAIDGERLQVYIDQKKVLDASVLDANGPKHFFITTDQYRNNAKAFISNFKIAGF